MVIQNSSALTAPGSITLNLQVSSVDDLARLARVFAASGLFGRANNQETQIAECAIRLMAGMEAGFSPFASATGVHIINGKPAFSANLLAQAVRRHPDYDYRVLEKTSQICRIRFLSTRGEVLGEETFTIEMADRAGLLKNPTWRSYPEAMLFSRALTAGMRTHCPDALGGHPAYTPEELGGDEAVVPVTVTKAAIVPMLTTTEDLAAGADRACRASGLTDLGLAALAHEISKGKVSTLDQLPKNMLARLAKSGVTPQTVERCNAPAWPDPKPPADDLSDLPADDPSDLPAAWSV